MINIYDMEVFEYDWVLVTMNPIDQTKTVIHNDREKLINLYEQRKNEIWVGFNSRAYDQHIFKAILCDFNPKKVNDHIIVHDKSGWNYSNLMNKIQLYNYDVMTGYNGLKTLEGFMGNDIKETSVPFDIDRPLTGKELQDTIRYCTHDVEQTLEVFMNRKEDFDAHMGLIQTFKLPMSCISKTQAQLVAVILEATRQEYNDEFDIKFPDTLQLKKYKYVEDWYRDTSNRDYSKKLETTIAGVPHVFGWGGVHGAIENYYGEGVYLMADVSSLYPSLMIRYNYHSRSIKDPSKYVEIYETNLRMKKEKNPLRPAFKLICNTTYGTMKDKFNPMYDPQMANNVCVAGQLLLLDLIEHLEPYCTLIQSNTDGILIKLKSIDDFDLIDDLVYEWEQRTGLSMEFDLYGKVYQGDVNNYLITPIDGIMYNEKGKENFKRKGAWLKQLNALDYDLPIVNKALVNYMTQGIPIEQTILSCDDLIEFQKAVKLTGKYDFVMHNGIMYSWKCYRVFASKNTRDGIIYKCKHDGKKDKIGNTPEQCFINNDNIIGVKCPEKLDKQYYVNLAKDRIKKFGVTL